MTWGGWGDPHPPGVEARGRALPAICLAGAGVRSFLTTERRPSFPNENVMLPEV